MQKALYMYKKLLLEKSERKTSNLEDLSVKVRILLKQTLKEWGWDTVWLRVS
jgi:hypothetical protein